MGKVHKRCISSVVLGLPCFENRKILPFWAMSSRRHSDVVSGHQEEACSSGDTHSWLRNCQRENEPGREEPEVAHLCKSMMVNVCQIFSTLWLYLLLQWTHPPSTVFLNSVYRGCITSSSFYGLKNRSICSDHNYHLMSPSKSITSLVAAGYSSENNFVCCQRRWCCYLTKECYMS